MMNLDDLITALTLLRDEVGGEVPVCDTDAHPIIGTNFDDTDGKVYIEASF